MRRVFVVSDTHLSPRAPTAESNWAAVAQEVAARRPELVVHAGDLTLDGLRQPTELAAARAQLDQLPVPWVAVPGNHDIGDTPGPPAADPDRLEQWRNQIGPDYWAIPVGHWTLIGINAQLLGSGIADEETQWAWLQDQLATHPPDRPIALIVHKPVFASDTELAAAPSYRFVSTAPRERLLGLLDTRWCPLVISGHVHQYRLLGDRDRLHAWAPSTWAVLPARAQAVLGLKRAGLLAVELPADGAVRANFIQPAGLTPDLLT